MKVQQFLSKIAKNRQPSAIRSLLPLMKTPGMISLAGGLPNSDTFPFESCSFKLKDGSTIDLSSKETAVALQYAPTEGIPEFHSWLKEHQQQIHKPPMKDWTLVITTGSQDAISKAFEMIIDEGDAILVENPTYSGALSSIKPLNPELIEIDIDSNGINPDCLEKILEERSKQKEKPFPKCLYTIPTGQNPSGATLTMERKKKIYSLAQKYNFLILEDDPYFYLTLDEEAKTHTLCTFLSLDVDGRVLRFDSLSKVLSSGIRIGWCTGNSDLIKYIHLHLQASELHTSAISQSLAFSLLKKWGKEGLEKHINFIQQFYRERRDSFIDSIERHLKGYVEYSKPSAGMFVWFKLLGIDDSKIFIEEKARQKLVLLVPGQAFQPNDKTTSFVRASFSVESKENMDSALERLGELLRDQTNSTSK